MPSMREQLEAQPAHAGGAVVPNGREVAFMLRVRAHLADEKMWLRGKYFPLHVRAQLQRGMYVPVKDTPACLIGTALLLQGMAGGTDYSWGEKVVKRSMGFMTFTELYKFNDTCTHAELLARLDAAILKLREGE